MPDQAADRFTSMGLIRQVLGSYEITGHGQLELHRQRFRRTRGQKFVRVTRGQPVYLHEDRFQHKPLSRARLDEYMEKRRSGATELLGDIGMPRFVNRAASALADGLRRWRGDGKAAGHGVAER